MFIWCKVPLSASQWIMFKFLSVVLKFALPFVAILNALKRNEMKKSIEPRLTHTTPFKLRWSIYMSFSSGTSLLNDTIKGIPKKNCCNGFCANCVCDCQLPTKAWKYTSICGWIASREITMPSIYFASKSPVTLVIIVLHVIFTKKLKQSLVVKLFRNSSVERIIHLQYWKNSLLQWQCRPQLINFVTNASSNTGNMKIEIFCCQVRHVFKIRSLLLKAHLRGFQSNFI